MTMATIGPASADSLRCGNRLVTDGDSAGSVIRACGRPSFRDLWRGATVGPPMMEWTYNHGPRRLLDQIIFRGDRVMAIQTAGYGFIEHRIPPSGSCEPTQIQPGLSKFRLLHICGRPLRKTGWYVNTRVFSEGGHRYFLRHSARTVYRERWIYNFGGNRLLRDVTLENARVVSVKTLERGFNPR